MLKFPRTAFLAALSFSTLIALGGSGAAPAFGAEAFIDSATPVLLPDSVRAAALQEGETPADLPIAADLSQAPAPKADIERGSSRSLSELVSAQSATKTSSREQECLAGAVYFEAKGEPLDGQLAVAKVIQNRARSGRFASSICGVVKQPSQFSFIRNGAFPAIDRTSRNWKSAVAIARIAEANAWNSSVNNALYFHARYVSPRWKLTRVASIGNHVFYR
jgi:N-acetylmuramoyl-L-alanine amidase